MRKYWQKGVVVSALVVLLLALSVSGAAAYGGYDGNNYHVVQYGETLFSIGRLYGVNPYTIAAVNHLYNPNCIYAGQVLYIPQSDYWNPGQGCYSGCYGYGYGYGYGRPGYGYPGNGYPGNGYPGYGDPGYGYPRPEPYGNEGMDYNN